MIQLLLFLNCFNQADCRSIYLDKIFGSQNLSKYFIVVSVKVDKEEGEMVVLNKNLYNALKKRDRKFTKIDDYNSLIKNKVLQNNTIDLAKTELKKMNTKLIIPDSSVLQWSEEGEEKFIEHYFQVYKDRNYATLKNDVHAQSIPTIVKILFNWNYLTTSVEGNLVIEQLNFCKKSPAMASVFLPLQAGDTRRVVGQKTTCASCVYRLQASGI